MNRNEHADDRSGERAAATDAPRAIQPPSDVPLQSPDESPLMRDTAVQGEDPQRDSRAPDVERDRDHPTQPPAADTPPAAGSDAAPGARGD